MSATMRKTKQPLPSTRPLFIRIDKPTKDLLQRAASKANRTLTDWARLTLANVAKQETAS